MKKIIALLCAFVIACVLVRGSSAAPEINTWGVTAKVIWPIGGVASGADTVGMLASDSVATTDSVNVFGARYIVLVAYSTGAAGTGAFNGGTGTAFDSLAVPILQTNLLAPGQWVGAGGTSNIPYSGTTVTAIGGTTIITNPQGRGIWATYNEPTTAGSTPPPLINSWFRWRLKSTNARRYATASLATLAPSGRITVVAFVWR